MQRTQTRIAGATAALLAAGVAGFSLRPTDRPPASTTDRTPAAEVRTKVIRRTIHIVRHEHPRSRRSPASTSGTSVNTRSGPAGSGRAQPITSGSSRHAGTPIASAGASAPVTTRTSAHATAPATGGSSASAPVTTRTSAHGSSGSSGSGSAVRTRTSAGRSHDGGDDGGD